MEKKLLTELAKSNILGNNKLMGLLMGYFDRGQPTLENWIAKDNEQLTDPACIKIICDNTGLFETQVVYSVVEDKANTAA